MKTINSFNELMKLASKGKMYIRWSRGPALDKKQRNSLDYSTYTAHNGLSAQRVYADRPKLAARMLVEYRFLRGKDSKIFGWVFYGEQIGTDSDGAPTVDADSIVPVGRLSDDLVEMMVRFSTAYGERYYWNPQNDSHHEHNARVEKEISESWNALLNS